MTTITIDKRMLEKLYLYWLEDADPRELDEFTAQVRTTLSAPATAPAQPAWHDAPTCEGMWVCLRDSRHKSYRVRDIEVQVTIPEDGDRWYGPIPEDRQ